MTESSVTKSFRYRLCLFGFSNDCSVDGSARGMLGVSALTMLGEQRHDAPPCGVPM